MAGSGVDFRGEDLEETMESQLEPTGEDIPGLHDGSDNQVEEIVADNLTHAYNGSCSLGENIRSTEYLMSWLNGPAGGDDQEGAGQGPHDGSFLE